MEIIELNPQKEGSTPDPEVFLFILPTSIFHINQIIM